MVSSCFFGMLVIRLIYMNIIYILIPIIIFGFGLVIWFLDRRMRAIQQLQEAGKQDSAINMLSQNINQNMQGLQTRIDKTTNVIGERLDRAAQAYSKVARELGTMQEIGREMKALQDFLKSPKLRGNIGEEILRDLLEQVLPKDNFSMQYKFQHGQIVDAIIKTNQGIVPIDSKFPMTGYKKIRQAENKEQKKSAQKEFFRDIKKHIKDISKKYILPQEGTVDFAVMYVPSESVYYEIMVKSPELVSFGQSKKVFFVSPNNFYYFLKIIMIGLEGAKMEKASKQIFETLKSIQHESGKFAEDLRVLFGHINNTKNSSERVNSQYMKLSSKIDNIELLEEKNDKKLL
ncbi:hypothetical protein CL633_02795 [bacterium]|nr:hypothetical protein [bacterium]